MSFRAPSIGQLSSKKLHPALKAAYFVGLRCAQKSGNCQLFHPDLLNDTEIKFKNP